MDVLTIQKLYEYVQKNNMILRLFFDETSSIEIDKDSEIQAYTNDLIIIKRAGEETRIMAVDLDRVEFAALFPRER